MPNCFLPGCTNTNRAKDKDGKTHQFVAPKKMAQEWIRLLTPYRSEVKYNPENRDHRLCFIHFRDEDIIKGKTYQIQGKEEFIPYLNWRLKDDVIPRFLPKLPKHLRSKVKARPSVVSKNVKGGDSGGVKGEIKAYSRKRQPASVPVEEEPLRVKQFPIETKGHCLICLMPATKSKTFSDLPLNKIGLENMVKEAKNRPTDPVSLLSLCRQLEIDIKEMGSDQVTLLDIELKARLCISCEKQISDTLDCFRRLELLQRELENYLLTIHNSIMLESKGAKLAAEMYRTDMMNDESSLAYLGIVDGIRKQIGAKCGEERSKLKCLAVPQAQQDSIQSTGTKIKTYDKYSSKKRRVNIKQSEVVSVPSPAVSSLVDEDNPDDYVKAEAVIPDCVEDDSNNSCGLGPATSFSANQEHPTDMDPLTHEPEEDFEFNPSVKEEQPEHNSNILTLLPDPENDTTHSSDHHSPTETECLSKNEAPTDTFPSKDHATTDESAPHPRTSIAFTKPKNTVSNPVKCQLCKVKLSSSSLEVIQKHFSEAHPLIKIAKKCALCQKVYLGKHDNCPKQVSNHPFLSRIRRTSSQKGTSKLKKKSILKC